MRIALGVIAGYLVTACAVFLLFTLAYLLLGADGSFRSGTYEVSTTWIVVSFVLSLLAAIAGGMVSRMIGRSHLAPLILAVAVVLIGIILAVPVLRGTDSRPVLRTGEVGNLEAMQNARQPASVALLNPLVGAIGVFIGGRLRRRA
jgi:hypothetical protein